MGSTRYRSRIAAAVRAALVALLLAGLIAPDRLALAAVSAKRPGLFGSHEKQYRGVAKFKKWQSVLRRRLRWKQLAKLNCKKGPYVNCGLYYWQKLVVDLKGKDRLTQIKTVHKYLNEVRYIKDPRNWNVADYWETPTEFFDKQGDCEDYSITKYLTLRQLGFSSKNLRIAVVKDLNLNLWHAILIVYHKGRALVLDNQIRYVIDARKVHHYRVTYSINEKHWWKHRH
jgi:predicted transglutaminase-like cysteine proteinase